MAAPIYQTDLTVITTAETTTGWTAVGGGGAGLSASPDLAMQGTNCVDKQITNAEKGMLFDNGSGVSMASGDHTYVWLFMGTPGLTDTLANRGLAVGIGHNDTNYCKYHVDGKDTYGAGGRVGKCYVVNQEVRSSNTGSIPYRTLVGTPNGTFQLFGGIASTTASVKGANLGVDAIRKGTGIYITAGDGTTPGTFTGAATQNDSVSNRWGVLTLTNGVFELQGRLVIGQNTSKTPTAAHFVDSNKTIQLINTPHSAADFTRIVVDHASTVCTLSNITVNGLGTNNPGRFIVNAGTVTLTSLSFNSIGITTLQSTVTVTDSTWRSSGQITTNGATLSGCLLTKNTAAMLVADLGTITGCVFESPGTGHAIELTSLGSGTMSWDNLLSGYAATDGSSGNEAIFVNVGSGTVTINVAAGKSIPSIRTAGATVNVVSGQVQFALSVKDSSGNALTGYEWRIYEAEPTQGIIGTVELAGEEIASASSQSYDYTYTSDQSIAVQVINTGYVEYLQYFTLTSNPQTININLTEEVNI